MDRKLIFLDIDGTLTSPGCNVPPDSALEREYCFLSDVPCLYVLPYSLEFPLTPLYNGFTQSRRALS